VIALYSDCKIYYSQDSISGGGLSSISHAVSTATTAPNSGNGTNQNRMVFPHQQQQPQQQQQLLGDPNDADDELFQSTKF
jgi:hypothetical protein